MTHPDPSRSNARTTILTIVIALVIALVVRSFVVETFSVSGNSMRPTFHNADRVLVDKLAYLWSQPRTGQIIVFQSPEDPTQDWIKRVIGVPGDTVSIRNNVVYINGKRYPEPFLKYRHSINVPPTKVPTGYLWVLGDNRPVSDDSRYWGLLPESRVKGQAILQWWPLRKLHWLSQ
ncbi:signal peptidase I [Sulfobacillus harzensis]|uniref:signal peptidase I n=1 Tax=Sulfobacillus harzensis TaxID=2729629 RepID=UPI0030844E2B